MRPSRALRRPADTELEPVSPPPVRRVPAGLDAVLALQRSAGNQAVARMLMRAPEAEVNPEPAAVSESIGDSPQWSTTVVPKNPAVRSSPLGDGTKVYRGDVLEVRARFAGIREADQEYIQAHMDGAGLAGQGGWATTDTYAWTIPVMTIGSYALTFDTVAQGEPTGHHTIDLHSVTDATDLSELLDGAGLAVLERFTAAIAGVGAATSAWTEACARQQSVLDTVNEEQRLLEDAIWGLLLATVAGAAGGALAGFLKNTAAIKAIGEKAMIPDMQSTAIIDGSKDFLKYAMRTMPQLTGGAGASPNVTGDSAAAPAAPGAAGGGPEGSAQGDAPTVFLGKLHKQLGLESSALLGEIKRLKFAAADAIVVGSTEEFDEDPRAFIEGDTILQQLATGLPAAAEPYLEQLWGAWLGRYAHVLVPLQVSAPVAIGDRPPTVTPAHVGNNVSSRLREEIAADAQRCGTTFDAWTAKYAGPLKERLDEELALDEAGQCPA